jgi:hypothetical protein
MKTTKSIYRIGVLFFVLILLISIQAKCQTNNNNSKSVYTGIIEYTTGGFDGYDYPKIGDSVLVYIEDNKLISLTVFPPNERNSSRHLNISFKNLKLVKKKEYVDIVAIDKLVPTGNYDMKFSYGKDYKDGNNCTVNLSHFGNGSFANITLIEEENGLRINNLLIANLVKMK